MQFRRQPMLRTGSSKKQVQEEEKTFSNLLAEFSKYQQNYCDSALYENTNQLKKYQTRPLRNDQFQQDQIGRHQTQLREIQNKPFQLSYQIETLREFTGKNLANRLKTESKLISSIINDVSLPDIYILDFKWAQAYTSYLKGEKTIMEPINNENLLSDPQLKKEFTQYDLRHGLKRDKDFVLLNQKAWSVITRLYGGGPEIIYIDKPYQPAQSSGKQVLHSPSKPQSAKIDPTNFSVVQRNFYMPLEELKQEQAIPDPKKVCPICYIEIVNLQIVTLSCLHIFCRSCIEKSISKCSNNCPVCRQIFNDYLLFINDKDGRLEGTERIQVKLNK